MRVNGYANLFVGYVEHQFFNQYNGLKPKLYGRNFSSLSFFLLQRREECGAILQRTVKRVYHPIPSMVNLPEATRNGSRPT